MQNLMRFFDHYPRRRHRHWCRVFPQWNQSPYFGKPYHCIVVASKKERAVSNVLLRSVSIRYGVRWLVSIRYGVNPIRYDTIRYGVIRLVSIPYRVDTVGVDTYLDDYYWCWCCCCCCCCGVVVVVSSSLLVVVRSSPVLLRPPSSSSSSYFVTCFPLSSSSYFT